MRVRDRLWSSLSIDLGEPVPFPVAAGSIGQQVGCSASLGPGIGKSVGRQPRSNSGRTPWLRHRDRTQEDVGPIPLVARNANQHSAFIYCDCVLWPELCRLVQRHESANGEEFRDRGAVPALRRPD